MLGDRSTLYADGRMIFEENSVGKDIYLIERGKVEISRRTDGEKTTIAVLEQGDFFGEMAPLTDILRTATATAVGDTYLRSFSVDEMVRRMTENSQLMIDVFQRLVNRLRSTTLELGTTNAQMHLVANGKARDTVPRESAARDKPAVFWNKDVTSYYYTGELRRKDVEIASLRRQLQELEQNQRLSKCPQEPWYRRRLGKTGAS